jgi:hypothetical protein
MTKSNEIFLFTAAALLAGVFYMAVPGILLSSDFEHGGVQQVLEAVQDSGYNEIRLIAFYAPATALVLFLLFAITLIARNKGSVHIKFKQLDGLVSLCQAGIYTNEYKSYQAKRT